MARRALTVVMSNLVLLVAVSVIFHAEAQTSPAELAQAVVERWSAGTEKKFASIYPFREGRDALSAARGAKSRVAGLANVIRASEGQAVLLISGVPSLPNSGDATVAGAEFSGVYEARAESGAWKLHSRIPLENLGRILAHDIKVSVVPASGVTVEDRLRIRVKGRDGFALRLNHAAKIESIRAAGREPAHLFGGGLLWVELPKGETELTIRYSIDVENGPQDTNSGCFLENAGHMRNQYFWHPFFGFDPVGEWADFHIEVRIPKEYRVSTSIPQTERVAGGERIIEGKTIQPAFALTLVYDRDWKVESRTFGGTRVEFFVSPEIQPDTAAIFAEFRSVYGLLSSRFGALRGGYFAVVQARSWKDNPGWRFASNQAVVSAMAPGVVSIGSPIPSAPLGHEIAHFWTEAAAGPAKTFLSEGWAVWAESAIVENEFGAEAAKEFWKYRANMYFLAYDGKASLLEDEGNAGVAYMKGPWLFHMLEDAMGKIGFQQAIAEYFSRSLVSPGGWELLAECAQRHAPADFDARSFLRPWLTEKRAPHLTAQIAGRAVTIHQEPSVFEFPLVVEASTTRGPERRRAWIKGPETVVTFSGDVSDVKIDPDASLLLRR
jgi:hypothetical protein